jgi:cell division GTPase FtsZ
MRLAAVGVGHAGSRIVNRIRALEAASGRNLCDGHTLLINSTAPTFTTTEHVPDARRLTIGDVYWEADGADIDGDPDLAAEIAREERNEIVRAFDLIEFHEVDGVLVVAGLAGGTGGGAGAVVIDQLQSICDEPVYGVGVLPAESEGQRPALTASRTLQSFVGRADNVLAFDNDAWLPDGSGADTAAATADTEPATVQSDGGEVVGHGEGAADRGVEHGDDGDGDGDDGATVAPEAYVDANVALAERLVTLFAAGEFGGASASEHQLDPSDIVRTLDTGGLSSIGYASIDLPPTGGLDAWIQALCDRFAWLPDRDPGDGDEPTDAAKINRLVRRAARSKLTLPCRVSSADRALIVLSGPSRTLSRKGFESGRYWLEREAEVVDVMAGDEPHDGSRTLTAVVLFSNVTDVPRIDAMQETALDHRPAVRNDGWRFGTANPS